jgi:hypothetical protein
VISKELRSNGQTILQAQKPQWRGSISWYVEINADDILGVAGPTQRILCMIPPGNSTMYKLAQLIGLCNFGRNGFRCS